MNPTRRRMLVAAVASAVLAPSAFAQADRFPSKPIQIVITSTPGSASDAITRLLGNEVTKALGQPIVVVSKASAAGTIGAEFVRRAAPDGYTLFFGGNTTMAANVHLVKNLGYDPLRDFEPITHVTVNPLLLIVRSDLPVRSVAELIAYAKSRPGQLNYGVGNSGARVSANLLLSGAGLKAQDISFNGASQAMMELVAGRLDFMFTDPLVADAFLRQGTVRALAVSSTERLPILPELPTMAEAGIAGYDYVSFLAYYAPKGTPRPVIDTLNAAFVKAIRSPEAQEYFKRMGAIARPSTPEALTEFQKGQIESWGRWSKAAGLEAQ